MKPSPRKENGRSLKIALCFYAIHFSGCRWLTKAVWTTQRLTRTRGCKRSHAFRYNIEGRTTLNDSRRTRSREMRSFSSRLTRFTRELFHVNTFQIWHIVKWKVSNRLLRFFFSFFLFLICMHNYVIIGLDKNPFVDEIMTKNLLNWIPCISTFYIRRSRKNDESSRDFDREKPMLFENAPSWFFDVITSLCFIWMLGSHDIS